VPVTEMVARAPAASAAVRSPVNATTEPPVVASLDKTAVTVTPPEQAT